jgi:hypothetical protein
MHGDDHKGLRLDPLGDREVQRALALSRARESYPALPREVLLEYCEAAWEVALTADPKGRDLIGTFDRALLTIAWTRRHSGGRVPLRDLVDLTIPRVALEPFVAAPREAAEEDPDREAALGDRSAEAPAPWRSLLRVPFTSPIPVGAAVAAGVVGVALLNETRVLPLAPPQLAGNDEATPSEDAPAPSRSKEAGGGPAAPPATSGSSLLSSGLVADELDDAAAQARQAGVPSEPGQGAAVEARRAATASEHAARDGAAATTADAAPGSTGGAPEQTSSVTSPQPVVRLQMPEPAILVEVGVSPIDEEEPDDSDEMGGPEDDEVALGGVVVGTLGEDEGPADGRGGNDDVAQDGDGRKDRSERVSGRRGRVTLGERLGQNDDREGDETSNGDAPAAGGEGDTTGEEESSDDGEESPGGPESAPLGEETAPGSPGAPPVPTDGALEVAPPPSAPAPAPAPPAEAPAAPAPEPAAPADAPAAPAPEPAAPAPEPSAPAPAAPEAPPA